MPGFPEFCPSPPVFGPPIGAPQEVKKCMEELLLKVIANEKPSVKKKSQPGNGKSPKPPKRPSVDEAFASNVTRTVNKLDDRLSNVAEEIGGGKSLLTSMVC